MNHLKIIGLTMIVACVLLACSSAPDATHKTAASTAGKVRAGMTLAEVEKSLGGKGVPDAVDPNKLNFPTADGNVVVTLTNGTVSTVETTNDR